MSTLEIPVDYQAVTSEWLTRALRSTGVLQDAAVTALAAAPLGQQRGFTGVIVRFELDYDQAEDGAPAALVAKFPAPAYFDPPDPDTLQWVVRAYRDEIRFYREIAPGAPLRTPAFYYGDVDPDSGHAVLLIEDLSDAVQISREAGWTAEQIQGVLVNIARFHAAYWDSPQLETLDWIGRDGDDPEERIAHYGHVWPAFKDKCGDKAPLLVELGDKLTAKLPELLTQWGQSPHTLLHGDYHLRNMHFRGNEQIVYDWQGLLRGKGLNDVAYFFTLSANPADRRPREDELLRLYHATLVENGVGNYPYDQCLVDYRLMLARVLLRMVFILSNLDFSREEGLLELIITRVEAIMDDHDIDALLS